MSLTGFQLRRPVRRIAVRILSCWLAPILLVLFGGQFAGAQEDSGSETALRIEQQQLFEQLLARPDDLDAMFAYAVVSIRLREYEPAIATLERMLIYRNDLPRVKLELGSAYFRLGSYEVARFYFDEVLAGGPPPDVRVKVEEFLAEIDSRTKQNAFTGFARVGLIYSTNANLGADDRRVLVFGVDALLDPDFVASEDVGARTDLGFSHVYDLQRPNDDVWITQGAFTSLRYFEETSGDLDVLQLKTGPRLALNDNSYGPKVRPFIDFSYVREGGDFLYVSGGAGAGYLNTLNSDMSVFARVGARYRDLTADRNDSDGTNIYAEIGAERRIATGTTLRGMFFGSRESARESYQSNLAFGGRISTGYTYVPELSETLRQPWTLTAFAQVSGRWYDDPDPVVDPDMTLRETDIRVGLSHLFRIANRWSVSIETSYFDRGSNIRNSRLDNFEVGVFIGKEF